MNLTRRQSLAAFLLVGLLLLLPSPAGAGGRIVTDMLGRTVEVPQQVERIIAAGPGALRLVTYLDGPGRVVGVEEIETRNDQPRPYTLVHREQFEGLPQIGSSHGGDPEAIAAQNPDLILRTGITAGEADRLEQQTQTPVVAIVYASTLSTEKEIFAAALCLLGDILDTPERADELITFTEYSIDDLRERSEGIPADDRPRVYLGGLLYRGTHGIVSTDPVYAPFQFVQANNVASGVGTGHHFMVDREQILFWDPEILFVDHFSLPLVRKDLEHPVYQEIAAIKDSQIYGLLPANHYTTNFATELANSYYVGKILYPDRFQDIEPAAKADAIFATFVGAGVYEQMQEISGGFARIDLREAGESP